MDIGNLGKKLNLDEGEWIESEMEGVRFKVRSTNYKPFREATATLARRTKDLKTGKGILKFSVAAGALLAEHILLDWDGIKDGGKSAKYTPEKALAVLTSDDDFGIGDAYRKAVEDAGNAYRDQLAETAKEAAGN